MNVISRVFEQRVRGFRVVEVVALLALVAIIFWVYLGKAQAARERYDIGQVRREILQEQRNVKQLRAETAHLETYRRIETLSRTYLGLAPVQPRREATPEELAALARRKAPKT